MKFGLPMRVIACVLCGLGAFILAYSFLREEAFFWTFVCVVGSAAFLFPRPTVSMRERVRLVGLWELMAPVVLIVFATVNNPVNLRLNSLRLVFLTVFFVGAGTAARLFFKRTGK